MTELSVIEGGGAPARHGGGVDLIAVARQAEAAKALGATLIKSGLLPDAIQKPEQAMAVMIKGAELQIPPMYALSNIVIISGKPTLSAELMAALVRRAGHKLRVIESTDERCVVEGIRADDPGHRSRIEWTMDMARRANLAGKNQWKTYPATMLRWRALSAMCKSDFAEVIAGFYSPEELGAEVDEEGRIVAPSAPPGPAASSVDEEAGDALEAEVVEDRDMAEASAYAEHQAVMDEVDELLDRFGDSKLDKDAARRYAAESFDKARVTRQRLERLLEEDKDVQEAAGEPSRDPNPPEEEEAIPEVEGMRGAARKARRSQVELLETIAGELAEDGVEKLVERVGKPLADLTVEEAEDWLQRLDPDGVEGG